MTIDQVPEEHFSAGRNITERDASERSLASILRELIDVINALTGLTYQGTWDADANVPALASGVGTGGHFYIVSVTGSTDLDGETDWVAGDWAVFNGIDGKWEKADLTPLVASVNGKIGVVVLDPDDLDDSSTTNKFVSQTQIDAFHAQNSDTKLDEGGANEVTAAQAKTAHTHSQVTSGNPHGVTKTDVSLGNVTNDAQLKRAGSDWTSYTEESSPGNDDMFLMERDSDGNKRKVKFSNLGGGSAVLPIGHLSGFRLTRLSATQLQIAPGKARDSADAYDISSTGNITVAITTSGANGLDTGSESSSTSYHVFVCVGSSGVCGLLSLSLSPTLPTGYDDGYRQVGSWYNASDGDWAEMQQKGTGRTREYEFNEHRVNELRVLDAGNSSSWANVDLSDYIPLSCTMVQLMYFFQAMNGYCRFRPDGFSNLEGGTIEGWAGTYDSNAFWVMHGSRVVEYQVQGGPGDQVSLFVMGYREEL